MNLPDQAWLSPAKLNLFLHITGRREDGYHLLQTVFQFLNYSDELFFERRDDERIALYTDLEGVSRSENLVVKAAQQLQKRLPQPQGISIRINKRIPMGGGLGGGSSNAATTLYALNRIWRAGLEPGQLAELGLTLGADVPVFLYGHAAFAEGVGEILRKIEPPEHWYVVISPGVAVSTEEIFSHPQLTRRSPGIKIRDFLAGQKTENVCQDVVSELYPEVAKALEFLDTTAPSVKARMTGTGSCVFAPYKDRKTAEKAIENMPLHWHGFVAKSSNRSALYKP